ncbi:MAG TPA: cytochrome c biogenesis protein CcsA [Burkholderiales bacterium]|nr:cytochrome c biogenesis protein CcsA [Burkholderiales bacterium]
MPDIVIHVVASALYAALALHFWNTRWRRRADASAAGLQTWERVAILVPLALHAFLLYQMFVVPETPRFGFAFALSATLWMVVFIYWWESLFVNLEGVLPLALALAAPCSALTIWFPGLQRAAAPLEFRVHLLLSIFATGVLTVALLHALLMAVADRLLHNVRGAATGGALAGPLARLPPLLTIERLLFRLIEIAFALLTLTLATGLTLSETLFGRALRFNHETVFALTAWAVFAILLVGRHVYGWRGRTALHWTLAGFMLVILANIGSTFVLEVILGRT